MKKDINDSQHRLELKGIKKTSHLGGFAFARGKSVLDFGRDDVDEHALFELPGKGLDFALFELHGSIAESKEGVIGATGNVLSGVILRATLADDDIAFHGDLITINLDAKALGD